MKAKKSKVNKFSKLEILLSVTVVILVSALFVQSGIWPKTEPAINLVETDEPQVEWPDIQSVDDVEIAGGAVGAINFDDLDKDIMKLEAKINSWE